MCHSANTVREHIRTARNGAGPNSFRKPRTHGGEDYAEIRFVGYSKRGGSENPLNIKIQ
jgi:hypothetical protein